MRGRPSLEIRSGPGAEVPPGEAGELALFDIPTGRLTSYVYTPHASARQAGEAIISLGEISARADALAGASLPGVPLSLEGIRRDRASGQESVYYEARYAPQRREIPFLEPPIRLLLDASTGRLYRFDMDPEWLDPAWPPRPRLSREAAERVAAVLLRQLDLTAALGAGAALGSTATAELFTVRPNAWLGSGGPDAPADLRPAWVVPFRLAGAAPESPAHALYVDAESGRPLGGAAAASLEMPGR